MGSTIVKDENLKIVLEMMVNAILSKNIFSRDNEIDKKV